MPNIDSLMENGLYFTNTFSSSDYTGPCIQSIFSSRFPFGCGTTRDNYNKIYSKTTSQLTLLKEDGYHLYATLETDVFVWGMKEPFEDDDGDVEFPSTQNIHNGLGNKIMKKFDNYMTEPWFYYVHFMDLHKPYTVPTEFNHLKQSERYDHNISTIDSWIGKMLEKIDLEKTLVIITSDHGDYISPIDDSIKEVGTLKKTTKSIIKAFIPNSMKTKVHDIKQDLINKQNMAKYSTLHEKRAFKTRPMADRALFDEIIHIPLIFSGYTIKKSKPITRFVRSIDIFPTILDMVRISKKIPNTNGKSLIPLIEENIYSHEPLLLESTVIKTITKNPKAVIGIRTEDYKYFRRLEDGSNVHLYDLKNDPFEDNNIAQNSPKVVEKMEKILQEIQHDAINQPEPEKLTKEEEKELEEELRKMGYI